MQTNKPKKQGAHSVTGQMCIDTLVQWELRDCSPSQKKGKGGSFEVFFPIGCPHGDGCGPWGNTLPPTSSSLSPSFSISRSLTLTVFSVCLFVCIILPVISHFSSPLSLSPSQCLTHLFIHLWTVSIRSSISFALVVASLYLFIALAGLMLGVWVSLDTSHSQPVTPTERSS